jgi:hypothetical protein
MEHKENYILSQQHLCDISNLGKQLAIKIKPVGDYSWLSEVFLAKICSINEQKSTIGIYFESEISYLSMDIGCDFDHEIIVAEIFNDIKVSAYNAQTNSYRYDFSDFMILCSGGEDGEITTELLSDMSNKLQNEIPKIYDLQLTFL